MPLKISTLDATPVSGVAKVGPATLHFKFRLGALKGDYATDEEMLLAGVFEWDAVDEEDKPLPITGENVKALTRPMITRVVLSMMRGGDEDPFALPST